MDAEEKVTGETPATSGGEANENLYCSSCACVQACVIKIKGKEQVRVAQCVACGYRWHQPISEPVVGAAPAVEEMPKAPPALLLLGCDDEASEEIGYPPIDG